MKTLSIIVVLLPLLSAVINGIFCLKMPKKIAGFISSILALTTAASASIVFLYIWQHEIIIHAVLFEWFEIENTHLNWSIYVDQLTSIMFIVITFVSAVVHIYSLGYMENDAGIVKFLSFLSLFTFFMLALVSSDNFLQLFFGWEGVGLCSYFLIGFWYKKTAANKAAIKAFVVNRVSDLAFIIGIIMIITYSGQIEFKSVFQAHSMFVAEKINFLNNEFRVLDIVCLLLFIGCMGKSAQIGMHVWLPDAMEGPTPVSALIHAATMVTAGVFLLARCSYLFEYSPAILNFIIIIGGFTCLFAATVAVMQTDLKKIIAYSTCSQLGYMFMACGISAYQVAIFHLATHAFFKALLFLSAGSIIHATHEQNIYKMGGLREKMPITYSNFLIGSLAIIGIFPMSGFYSKDLILESLYATNSTAAYSMFIFGIFAAVLTAIYSTKIIVLCFHGKTKLSKDVFDHLHESHIMNSSLILLILGTVFSGIIGYYVLDIQKIGGYFKESIFHYHLLDTAITHHLPYFVEALPMIAGIIGILIGVYFYQICMLDVNHLSKFKILHVIQTIVKNKYYFDGLYSYFIVRPFKILASFYNFFDQKILDQFGPNGFARISYKLGFFSSKIQTGYLFNYTSYIVLSVVIFMTWIMTSSLL